MAVFNCKMCGGQLNVEPGDTIVKCEYCRTKQTLPRLDEDRKANLYNRAGHFRRNNEFDKAMGIYEQILNEDSTDAESYWSILLCRYGIEYVEDPATKNRIPTVNRAQFTSIFDDEDYKSAIKYADLLQKEIYETEASAINEIQKGILAISQKEDPFDVFICYKETDANGRRTPDSVLAQELYYQLKEEGFKVFFSRITLEDKLGSAYEPYIFAALNSAKVMVALGTRPEHFSAVWVKNEWSRYLSLIKSGAKKTLIPAYRDMDPYDLPEEFSHLQAQDMSKLGFMQDLIRGIKKIAKSDEPKPTVVKETIVAAAAAPNIDPLLKRAFMFLEDGEFDRADEFCEQVLNQDPENAQAYLGKLMAELRVKNQDSLKNCAKPFNDKNNYKKAARFGNDELKKALQGYIDHINTRNENARLEELYTQANKELMSARSTKNSQPEVAVYKFLDAATMFEKIRNYRDSAALEEQCKIESKEAEELIKENAYRVALVKMNYNTKIKYNEAIKILETIRGYKDVNELIAFCKNKIIELKNLEEEKRLALQKHKEEVDRKNTKKSLEKYCEKIRKNIKSERRKILRNIIILLSLSLVLFIVISQFITFETLKPNSPDFVNSLALTVNAGLIYLAWAIPLTLGSINRGKNKRQLSRELNNTINKINSMQG